MNDKFIWRYGDILIAAKLQKARVYIEPGTQPPLGTQVETGPRGGTYYESENIPAGMEEVEPPPAEDFGPQVLTKEALTEAEMFSDGTFGGWVEDFKDAHGIAGEQSLREVMKHRVVDTIVEKTGLDYELVNAHVKSWAASSSTNRHSVAMQRAAVEEFGLAVNPFIKNQHVWGTEEEKAVERDVAKRIVRAMYDETQEWLKEQGVRSLVLFRGMRWVEGEAPSAAFAGEGDDVEFFANPLSSWSSDPETAEQFANMEAAGAEGEPDYEDEDYQECLEEAKNVERESFINERRNNAEEEGEEPDAADIEEWEAEFDDSYEEYDTGCEPPDISPKQVRAIAVAKVPADKIIALSVTGLGCLDEKEVVVAGGEQSMRMYSDAGYGGEISLHDFVEEGEPEPEKPKTAQEQQEAQRKQWYVDNINPLFDRLTQQQMALREDYQKRFDAISTDVPLKGKDKEEFDRLRAEYWEIYHEIRADAMAEGKKLIVDAGYMPEGGWETAEEAPLSPELAAWRKEHYAKWVEENLQGDAQKWVDKTNELTREYAKAEAKLRQMPPGSERHKKLIKLAETRDNVLLIVNKNYFRLGAKKIREAGFEPKGHFAERERLDAEAKKEAWVNENLEPIKDAMFAAREEAKEKFREEHLDDMQKRFDALFDKQQKLRQVKPQSPAEKKAIAVLGEKRDAIRNEWLKSIGEYLQRTEQPYRIAASKKLEDAGMPVPDHWKPHDLEKPGQEPE